IGFSPLSQFADLDALILAVPHAEYLPHFEKPLKFLRSGGVLIDIKSALRTVPSVADADVPLRYWSL
ncbi:MAG TPA: hypothetical protein VFN03_01690, partial [Trueperaceae bacterium]|nr:hypothetical protein [Trueperaceae bacterium]